MKINRKAFYDNYRACMGRLTQKLVDNINEILTAVDNEPDIQDSRMVGCVFGNSYIESAGTFEPVVEGYWIKPESKRVNALYYYYAKNNPGALRTIFPNGPQEPAFYGRGRVTQTTHDFNYLKASKAIFGDDRLLLHPELILEPQTDLKVAFRGMLEGWFTGKKLSDYFNNTTTNFYKSRKIINSLDRASEIATIAKNISRGVEFVSDEIAMQGYNQEEILA